MSLQSEIEILIATYLTAWNARDFEGMAALFSEPATYVVPGGSLSIPDRSALISKLKDQFAALEADGFDHTEIGSISARQCNDTTAIVDLKGVARLRSDGSALEVIDAVYVCVLQNGAWHLSIAIGCWPDWRDR